MHSKIKRRLIVLSFMILLPLLAGMGSSGSGKAPDKIPVPAKKFTAVAVDQSDIATEASGVSIEGTTFLEGKKGDGTFTIAFDKIQYVDFLMKDGKLNAYIKLRDGSVMELTVNKQQMAFGRTPYGTFQITLGDLKRLTITNGQRK